MAFDLSTVSPKSGSTPDPAFQRETTMPRQGTDRPDLAVPQQITRPAATNNAAALAKILGVAVDVATSAFEQGQAHKANEDAAAAALDFGAGHQDTQKYAKSLAYRDAWQFQGAKHLAVTIGDEVTKKVQDRLNDDQNPATLDDVDRIIEGTFQNHIIGPDGKPNDFGTPQAKMVLVNALNEVRSTILPQAQAAIKKQTDTRFLSTWSDNNLLEYNRGAPIGAKRDPLAPLPGPEPAPSSAPSVAYSPKPVEPFNGFLKATPTSVMGAARQGGSIHNGEDYAIPTGTPLVAPMPGKVIAAFSNDRGGNQVRVQMADGAIVGYAHLSKLNVSVGDEVRAGQPVGLSGATGDATGPHVHMTVEVNGKKVSPKSFFNGQVSSLASAPLPTDNNAVQLASVAPDVVPSNLPPFDFEKAMSELPPSIDKKEGKTFLLQAIINEADSKGDVGVLAGLENSHRADGTPSFTPDEIATILKARDEIGDKARVDAERAQNELWKTNGRTLLTAMISNNPPSDDFIANAAATGKIDPSMGYTLIEHNKAAAREAASQTRFEQRQADAEADAGYDSFVAGEAARMSVGDFSGRSADDLFQSGKLGPPGKKALGRYHQLLAATRQGEERNRENPLYGQYMGELRLKYGAAATNPFLAPQFRSGTDNQTNYYGMVTFYKLKVSKGMEPEEAYLETIAKFGPKMDASQARAQLIKELQAKKAVGQ